MMTMYDMIKQCFDWGVYTADYVKSYFVDDCKAITEDEYNQIVTANK